MKARSLSDENLRLSEGSAKAVYSKTKHFRIILSDEHLFYSASTRHKDKKTNILAFYFIIRKPRIIDNFPRSRLGKRYLFPSFLFVQKMKEKNIAVFYGKYHRNPIVSSPRLYKIIPSIKKFIPLFFEKRKALKKKTGIFPRKPGIISQYTAD